METIGDGYQHLNNRQLEKALMDYMQFPAEQVCNPDLRYRFCFFFLIGKFQESWNLIGLPETF